MAGTADNWSHSGVTSHVLDAMPLAMTYRLHYAPDNASMIVRLALEQCGSPYEAALVDRRANAQTGADYLRLNPHGLIPAMETDEGVLFETGAILLWLCDRHPGLGPAVDDPARGDFLKWLFYLSNTLHPALRMLFYTDKYIDGAAEAEALKTKTISNIKDMLRKLDTLLDSPRPWINGAVPRAADFYLAACLRWLALYPRDRAGWLDLAQYHKLQAFARRLDTAPAVQRVVEAEGLGDTPFSAPDYPNPPEGSAL